MVTRCSKKEEAGEGYVEQRELLKDHRVHGGNRSLCPYLIGNDASSWIVKTGWRMWGGRSETTQQWVMARHGGGAVLVLVLLVLLVLVVVLLVLLVVLLLVVVPVVLAGEPSGWTGAMHGRESQPDLVLGWTQHEAGHELPLPGLLAG